jgi:hypothetical protein
VSMRGKICEIIYSRPGITQLEIAQSIYGPNAYQGLVKAICRQLLRDGYIARAGKGGARDPYTYTWACTRGVARADGSDDPSVPPFAGTGRQADAVAAQLAPGSWHDSGRMIAEGG